MSWLPCPEPDCEKAQENDVEMVIVPRSHDVGGFDVWRALPARERRMVGPFIFWDQMGPGEFLTGQGIDVRPHPHIGLSTLTYLFSGSLMHRDSLGSAVDIVPGDVNLMTAGKGIVHSERSSVQARQQPHDLFGIQSWLALPKDAEQGAPDFTHFAKHKMPHFKLDGVDVRVVLGEVEGEKSPIVFPHDALYADVKIPAGKKFLFSKHTEERALYPLHGRLKIGHTIYEPMQLLVLAAGRDVVLEAEVDTHVMVMGGAAMDGPRYIWWNFVSSSKELMEQAKEDWQNNLFPHVPGDPEYIPLPE